MIVDEVLEKTGDSYHFIIIDSTKHAHNTKDSRYRGRSGIGTAPVTLTPQGNYFDLQ